MRSERSLHQDILEALAIELADRLDQPSSKIHTCNLWLPEFSVHVHILRVVIDKNNVVISYINNNTLQTHLRTVRKRPKSGGTSEVISKDVYQDLQLDDPNSFNVDNIATIINAAILKSKENRRTLPDYDTEISGSFVVHTSRA